MNSADRPNAGFYFAFPRLIQWLLGGSAERSLNNWAESFTAGIVIYLIIYLFAAHQLGLWFNSWLSIPGLVLLAFGTWIFWLIVVYLNLWLIRALRFCGVFTRSSNPAAESILMAALTTLFAYDVVRIDSPVRWLAMAWFVILTLNLLSASVLLLFANPSATADT